MTLFPLTRNKLILLAAGGSAALLLGAFGFQLLGYAPCKLCLWQRWPHGIAVVIGLLALFGSGTLLPLLGALAAATTGALGVYHTGVEQGWWQGPNTCTSAPITNVSANQLMDQIMAAPLIRCDEIAWQFLGLSMAGWNAVISFALALVWLTAWQKSRN
jgi:disulfide bond formation protein DsbB